MEVRPRRHPRPSAEPTDSLPSGEFVELDGEAYYQISDFDRLTPFLMTIPGDTDLWMFVTSGGGLTAGREDSDGSLFPYLTVDELHDAHHHTGPLTAIHVEAPDGAVQRWQPFAESTSRHPAIERSIYKNVVGNRLVFEETHRELGLCFRYRWSGCHEFGWVRTSSLHNLGRSVARVSLLDGLRNLLPHGAPLSMYQQAGNLVDAYKKSEIDAETGLGIFSLTARITDKPEALESLKANTVWCCGLDEFSAHLPLTAIAAFERGEVLPPSRVLNGARGNYLVHTRLHLDPGASRRWHLVSDSGQDHVRIAELRRRLLTETDLSDQVEHHLRQATDNLRSNVASADGLQLSGHPEACAHHFANVLFNNMRGGVFLKNQDVPVEDLRDFLEERNGAVAQRHASLVDKLPAVVAMEEILNVATATGDNDFERLCYEYLPLHFGRRHGDPSRPWNRFHIRARSPEGEQELHYEGNWRDIFQNWEALATAFPAFLPNMVAKFVNASTIDGFNPYRITRAGVDWEVVSPDDPWSNIGYWGDHQIVYLLRLLESLHQHDPSRFGELLGREIFSYAAVPYRIKPYAQILRDPHDTIDFDQAQAEQIEARVASLGADGKLLMDQPGSVYHAALLEKLLVPALSKISNMVPDAGIWMNTQRPEWNDANNALAGAGASVVTLCYLRRYLGFLVDRLEEREDSGLPVSNQVIDWFEQTLAILQDERSCWLAESVTAPDRKRLMDRLGGAFSGYRDSVYDDGFTGKSEVSLGRVRDLFRLALEFIDRGLESNRREDGLFHTYNLLTISDQGTEVGRLPEMLEGQVAILSSGYVPPSTAPGVIEALFGSALYHPERESFLLYPERELPGFMEKNVVPEARVGAVPLLRELMDARNHALVRRDADGVYRFHGDFQDAADVATALDRLGEESRWHDAVERDRQAVLDLFEAVFHHRSYTGRSGMMYAYEGLGCIYWHMVAKLLLACQEHVLRADDEGLTSARGELAAAYSRIRAGLGFSRSVTDFGAFPTDPYSHTPSAGGAKQPGMTGQAKEEVLTRRGELGVRVSQGALSFQPRLLPLAEFLPAPDVFRYFDVHGEPRSIALTPGSLAFTVCQVPVIYELASQDPWIEVTFADGTTARHRGVELDLRVSSDVLSRCGRIDQVRVGVADPDVRSPQA